jgi:hypothetical protein
MVFIRDSINAGTSGKINLVDRTMDLDTKIEPLGTVSSVVGGLPILGDRGRALTRVSLSIKGPISEPAIRLKALDSLSDSTRDVIKIPGSNVNKHLESAGEELQKLFRKQ